VASLNPDTLRSTGIDILNTLWAHNISAQLARDARTPDELTLHARDAGYLWIVLIKDRSLKIKQLAVRDAGDVEVASPDRLVSWIKQASDERQWQAGAKIRQQHEAGAGGGGGGTDLAPPSGGALGAGMSGSNPSGSGASRAKPRVVMLVAQNKSKKFNRQAAVEAAEAAALALLQSYTDGGPRGGSGGGTIVSCELSDKTIGMVRHTAGVADADGWKRVEASVPATERMYVRELHELLAETAEAAEGVPGVVLHNFRSGNCCIYQF
jgi:translation initiation factor 2-alpha kinase 4